MTPMLLLLAQAEPPAAALAQWLSVLFYLGGFVATMIGAAVGIKSLRTKEAETPQPFEVRAHPGTATEQQIKEVHGRIARERLEINAAIEERRQETKAISVKLDAEIKDLRQLMDDIPERTISLLAKTKGLL